MTGAVEVGVPEPFALYRWFDAADIVLYIGKTGELGKRVSGHISRSRWMQLAARSTVERYGTAEDVSRAEREAIEAEHPIFNKQYNNTPEARARMYAYLEGIGRLDLLGSRAPYIPAAEPAAPEPPEEDDWAHQIERNYSDADLEAYEARWERMAERAWWQPWWIEEDPLAVEDLLDIICGEYTITEAIGCRLRIGRGGSRYPDTWITYLPVWGETLAQYDTYAWSVFADLAPHEEFSGLSRDELKMQQDFAEALIAAGRCSSAQLGEHVILRGFRDKLEAKFAGVVVRNANGIMLRCTARLRGDLLTQGWDPEKRMPVDGWHGGDGHPMPI